MEPRFAVYVRDQSPWPELAEVEVGEYASYGDARQVRRELIQAGQLCVIRVLGETGGAG